MFGFEEFLLLIVGLVITATISTIRERIMDYRAERAFSETKCDHSDDDIKMIESSRQCLIQSSVSPESLSGMNSAEQRLNSVTELISNLCAMYEVSFDNIEIFNDASSALCGAYSCKTNELKLNVAYLFTNDKKYLYEFVDTIFHEFRHKIQWEAVSNPDYKKSGASAETIEIWRKNFANYVTKPYKTYWAQPVEVDARSFAELAMKEAF